MNNKDIEWHKKKLEEKRLELESGQLNAVRELLTDKVIKKICEESKYYFRSRMLTPLVTIFHMIGTGIVRDNSFQASWHLNGETNQSGALAKARKRLPLSVWEGIHEWMMEQIEEETFDDRWRGHRVIGIDGTCVSMSDEPELFKEFGKRKGRYRDARYPLARVLVMFNLKTMISTSYEVGGYTTGEMSLLRRRMPDFRKGDVLVLDRHFSGANLYAEYQREGFEFITRIRHRKPEELKVIQAFGTDDLWVEIPINAQYRKKDKTLPESVRVRIIRTEAKIRGRKETFWLVTSLMNPEDYPAEEIRAWYKKRWKVEGLIEELKVWVGADVLRSKTVEGIYKELYARIIGLNLIHWLILKAGRKHNKPIERISTSAALRLTAAYSLKMSTAPAWQLAELYRTLLERIAYSTIPDRPNRTEPRMIRRDTKHYPMLKMTRKEWCQSYAIAA